MNRNLIFSVLGLAVCVFGENVYAQTLVAPFGSNKELVPAHEPYRFPYKENYIMLPLTNGTITEDGGLRVIVNKPVKIDSRRVTVIPLGNGAPNVSPTPVVPQGLNGGSVAQPVNRPEGVIVQRRFPASGTPVVAGTVAPCVTPTYVETPKAPETATPEVPANSQPQIPESTPSILVPENSSTPYVPGESIVEPQPGTVPEITPSTSVDAAQSAPQTPTSSTPETVPVPAPAQPTEPVPAPAQPAQPAQPTEPAPAPAQPSESTPQSDPYQVSPPENSTPSGSVPSATGSTPSTSADSTSADSTSAWRSTEPSVPKGEPLISGDSPMIMTNPAPNSSQQNSPAASETQHNPQEIQSSKPMVQNQTPTRTLTSENSVTETKTEAMHPSGIRYVEERTRRHPPVRVAPRSTQAPTSTQAPKSVPAQAPVAPSVQPKSEPTTVPEEPLQLPPPEPGQNIPQSGVEGQKV